MGFKLLLCILVTLFQNTTKLLSGVKLGIRSFFLFSSDTRDPTEMTLNGTAKFFIVLNNYLNYQSLNGNPSHFLCSFLKAKWKNTLELDCLKDLDCSTM